MELGWGHFAAVVPHFGGNVGHRLAGQARGEERLGRFVTLGAAFGVEQCCLPFSPEVVWNTAGLFGDAEGKFRR